MTNSFVFPTGRTGTTVARIFAEDGKVWRKPTSLGGTDPAGLVAFNGGEAGAGKYDVAMTEIADAGGEFVFVMPAGVPAGNHSFRALNAGEMVAVMMPGDVGYWDGDSFVLGFVATDRTMLQTVYAQSLLIGAVEAATPATTGAAFDAVGAETAVFWSYTFTRPIDLTGWTKIAFTVKRDLDNDDDGDALVSVVVTNPAAGGTDGIKVHNRRSVAVGDTLRTAGAIVASSVTPTTTLMVTLLPTALVLPPSPDTSPYSFEINYWLGDGVKRQFGRGDFRLARSVRRGVVAP